MKEINATEGMYLTQRAEVSVENRIFVKALAGVNLNEADWREATKQEKEAHDAEIKAMMPEEVSNE